MIYDIIKTILVILVLRQGVSRGLTLTGIPDSATNGAVYRLQCSSSWLLKQVSFHRDNQYVARVNRRSWWRRYSCTIYNGDALYNCEASLRTKTLIINNINSTRDNNTLWTCSYNDLKPSNTYTIVVKTAPVSCKLTTTITHMKNTGKKDAVKGDDVDSDDVDGDGSGDDGNDISKSLVLNEGDDLDLNCSTRSSDNNAIISYKWELFSDYSQTNVTGNQSIYFKPNITRRDAGMYVCTGTSRPACDKNDVVYVRVQYPLTLNITVNYTSDAMELICRVVDGYPINYTMNKWTHYIDGQFVREIEGVTTQDRTALVLNNTLLNEGTYVCNASNGIKDLKGTVHQTDQTYINIEAPPTLLEVSNVSETHVGSEVELTTTFIIGGDVLNITWYQQQQNSSNITEISVDTKSEHGIRPIDIYGTEINKNVTIISGNVTVSKMVDLTVTVTVCTQYGCTESNQHVTVLPELSSSTVPFFTGKANNANSMLANDELPVNVPVIAGGVVAAVVLIALIILIIILVRRRSNYNTKSAGTARQNPTNSFRYRNPTYDTSQDQPTNDQCLYGNDNLMKNQQQITDNQTMEILENDLYISADDDPTPDKVDHTDNNQIEIMENDLYISADDDTNLRGTGLKDGEMEILENDLYISADDDDKNTDGVETKPEMEILENDLYIPLEIDTRVF